MIPLILLSSDESPSPDSLWCLVCPKGTLCVWSLVVLAEKCTTDNLCASTTRQQRNQGLNGLDHRDWPKSCAIGWVVLPDTRRSLTPSPAVGVTPGGTWQNCICTVDGYMRRCSWCSPEFCCSSVHTQVQLQFMSVFKGHSSSKPKYFTNFCAWFSVELAGSILCLHSFTACLINPCYLTARAVAVWDWKFSF